MGREEGSFPPRLSLVLERSEEELDALVEQAQSIRTTRKSSSAASP
jgi:hypothetical protein